MTQLPDEATITRAPSLPPLTEARPHGRPTMRRVVYGGLLAAVPAGVGLGIAAATDSRRGGIAAGATALVAMVAARWQLQRWFTEQPRYLVESTIGDVEIRSYTPRVVARTEVASKDFDEALDRGFRRLFDYIGGDNHKNEKIAMTVPVTVVRSIDGYTVSFVMPSDHPLSSLPRPRDIRIALASLPAQRLAALCFRGRYTGALVTRKGAEMVRQVLEGGLDTTGEPVFAAYDPPTTLGLLRRNEVWMELA
ncbi:MAG: heme-binding protein [Deltaproteobacteria bacterium]|nr:heme-binding protein [Kofleriaceae bacterium]